MHYQLSRLGAVIIIDSFGRGFLKRRKLLFVGDVAARTNINVHNNITSDI